MPARVLRGRGANGRRVLSFGLLDLGIASALMILRLTKTLRVAAEMWFNVFSFRAVAKRGRALATPGRGGSQPERGAGAPFLAACGLVCLKDCCASFGKFVFRQERHQSHCHPAPFAAGLAIDWFPGVARFCSTGARKITNLAKAF